jgi:hypothetical protein
MTTFVPEVLSTELLTLWRGRLVLADSVKSPSIQRSLFHPEKVTPISTRVVTSLWARAD